MKKRCVLLFLVLSMFAAGLSLTACNCDSDDDDSSSENVGLSPQQRAADFEHLVSMTNKYYGPIDWKEELLAVDLMGLADEYRDMIMGTTDDLDFFEIMFEYVSLFQDGHTGFSIPSTYRATLDFDVDIYEGKLIVDRIKDNSIPLEIGDEIISMNGESAWDLIERYSKYLPSGNELTNHRWATTLITSRIQELCVEETSGAVDIEFRRLDGSTDEITLAWETSGTPYIYGSYEDPFDQAYTGFENLMDRLQRIEIPRKRLDFLTNFGKYGHRAPSFDLPDSFVQRLGSGSDEFYSGTYLAEGKTIGFLRVPKMYVNKNSSYQILEDEIIALDGMTDGLVIDIMDNPGGMVYFCNFLSKHLHREQFPQILFEMRPTLEIIYEIGNMLNGNYSDEIMEYLQALYDELVETYERGDTLTEPVSLDETIPGLYADPAIDSGGNLIGYSKPIIILINELSISGGDYFPATMKDSGRAKLVGYRTAGGGGHVVGYYYEFPYSESSISMTGSLMYRANAISPEGYPETHYIENVGVHPHYEYDYQNLDDLLNNGVNYVNYFTDIILDEINS